MEPPSPATATTADPSRSRSNYLPRLPREFYQDNAVVQWGLTVFDRGTGCTIKLSIPIVVNENYHQEDVRVSLRRLLQNFVGDDVRRL